MNFAKLLSEGAKFPTLPKNEANYLKICTQSKISNISYKWSKFCEPTQI